MSRLYVILGIIDLAFTLYAFIDCVRTEDHRIKILPKIVWALLILIFSPVGAILWFTLGRTWESAAVPQRAGTPQRFASRPSGAPDDDPEFLSRLSREKEQEERIRKLEEKLSKYDDDPKPE